MAYRHGLIIKFPLISLIILSWSNIVKKLILLMFLFVVACVTSTDESSILDKSSCKLPCWNNIIVGQTTENELLQTLEHLPDVDQESIQNVHQPWNIFDNQILFIFKQSWTLSQKPKIRSVAYVTDNKVSEITFCGELRIFMGDIVDQVGEPDKIISGNNSTDDRTVILVNLEKGIQYSYNTDSAMNELEYVISPDVKIGCFTLFDPSLYEKLLEAKRFSNGYYNAKETLRVMYPWDGYGILDEKYPPRQP